MGSDVLLGYSLRPVAFHEIMINDFSFSCASLWDVPGINESHVSFTTVNRVHGGVNGASRSNGDVPIPGIEALAFWLTASI